MKDKLKILVLLILIIAVIGGIGYLLFNAVRSSNYNENAKNPIVTFEVEGYGSVKMELYPDYAPNTVKEFVKLVQNGYYDGKVFYGTDGKAVSGGMIKNEQEATVAEGTTEADTSETTEKNAVEDKPTVSDLDTSVKKEETETDENVVATAETETDENDYKISIDGEFVANGYDDNTLRFEKGVVGLYRQNYQGYSSDLTTESYNSGTSLFFISTEEDSTLNGNYAAFGKVIEGMDIIEQIKALPTVAEESSDTTTTEDIAIKYFENLPVITKATVETNGTDYGMPEYNKAFDYDAYVSNLILQYYQNQ